MRYLLDTNILSDFTKPSPSATLSQWIAERADEDLFISFWTLGELRRGVLGKPVGRKRTMLEQWFAGIQSWFAGRVLPYDDQAALIWARLMNEGSGSGKSRSALDMIIAATAEANGCLVVTGNKKRFAGIKILNSFRPPA